MLFLMALGCSSSEVARHTGDSTTNSDAFPEGCGSASPWLQEVWQSCLEEGTEGTFALKLDFEGCPEVIGVVIVGGSPARGEVHQPFDGSQYGDAWGGDPGGVRVLRLESGERHFFSATWTTFTCEDLLGAEDLAPSATLAVWVMGEAGHTADDCRAWGPDTRGLLAGDYDRVLETTDAGGVPSPGSPPPGGWSGCVVSDPPETFVPSMVGGSGVW